MRLLPGGLRLAPRPVSSARCAACNMEGTREGWDQVGEAERQAAELLSIPDHHLSSAAVQHALRFAAKFRSKL